MTFISLTSGPPFAGWKTWLQKVRAAAWRWQQQPRAQTDRRPAAAAHQKARPFQPRFGGAHRFGERRRCSVSIRRTISDCALNHFWGLPACDPSASCLCLPPCFLSFPYPILDPPSSFSFLSRRATPPFNWGSARAPACRVRRPR
jgi:hypothetical protein